MEEVEFYLEDLESKFSKIDPTKYVLSYSGGRDSHFLYWFIKERLKEPRIKIVGVNTTMEHPEILQRIKDNCDVVLRPVKKPRDVKKEKWDMRNTLGDLNNHLFAQLERLSDEDIKGEALKEELMRAEAVSSVAQQIIANGALVLKAQRMKEDSYSADATIPKMLEG